MERCVAVLSANEKVKVRNQSHIPNDLSFSILSKLPIKSFMRFGCVQKSWSLLFDNQSFMTMYRNHFLTKDQSYYDDTSILLHKTIFSPWDGHSSDETFELYCVSGERFENRVILDWPDVKLDPIFLDKAVYDSGFNILGSGSVHGILCLFCASQMNIILWNPSIKEFKLIPPSPMDYHSGQDWVGHVDYHVFGYDNVKHDYKVMRHITHKQPVINGDHLELDTIYQPCSIWEVYSLKSNSWRQLDFEKHHQDMNCGQLYMDGLSHWLCTSDTHDEIYLLSFDWSNEVFLTTKTNYSYDCFLGWLLLLNGYVALISNVALISDYSEATTFHISILGELSVKESWTKLFIIGPLSCPEYPIRTGKKDNMLFQNPYNLGGGLFWFDLNTQKIEDVGIETGECSYKIVIHKENLHPFEGKNI